MKVVRLTALRTQEIFLVLISVYRLSQPQGYNVAGRFMSMKNSNDTIWNRTRNLPAFSAVPQPITPPRYCYFHLQGKREDGRKDNDVKYLADITVSQISRQYFLLSSFIHSLSILSDDRSKASSKTIPPHSAI